MSTSNEIHNTRFKSVAITTISFLLLFLIVHVVNVSMGMSLNKFGLEPRTLKGIIGIFTAPLLHGSWAHLIGNSMSFATLAGMLFYFYPKLAFRILSISWLGIGILVWVTGRPSIHVGASGIIYAFAAFLFLSGIIRRHYQLMAVSLIVVFLYGSMIWGILPGQSGVSWESHLSGMLIGVTLAFYYRKKGLQKAKPSWESESESEIDSISQFESHYHTNHSLFRDIEIHYKLDKHTEQKNKNIKANNSQANKKSKNGFLFNPKKKKLL